MYEDTLLVYKFPQSPNAVFVPTPNSHYGVCGTSSGFHSPQKGVGVSLTVTE